MPQSTPFIMILKGGNMNSKLKIDIQKLPLIIELEFKGNKKEYVVKPNKNNNGIFLNLKESY